MNGTPNLVSLPLLRHRFRGEESEKAHHLKVPSSVWRNEKLSKHRHTPGHRCRAFFAFLLIVRLALTKCQGTPDRTSGFALWFDGINDFLGLQHSSESHWPRVDDQDWTIEYWVKEDTQPYFSEGNTPDILTLATPASGYIVQAGVYGVLIAGSFCIAPYGMSSKHAQHFAATVARTADGGCVVKTFLNGTEICSTSCFLDNPTYSPPRQPWVFGPAQQKDGRHNFPLVWLDNVRFWNGARKAEAIQATYLLADTTLQLWMRDPANAELLDTASTESVATFPSLELELTFDVPNEPGVHPGFNIPGSAPLPVASPFVDVSGSPQPFITVRGKSEPFPFMPETSSAQYLGVVLSLDSTVVTAQQVGLELRPIALPASTSRLDADTKSEEGKLSWCVKTDLYEMASGAVAFISDVVMDRLHLTVSAYSDASCSSTPVLSNAIERYTLQVLEPPPAYAGIGLDAVTLGTGYISIPQMPHSPEWTLEFWFQWSHDPKGVYCIFSWSLWPGRTGLQLCIFGSSGFAGITWPDGTTGYAQGMSSSQEPFHIALTSSREFTTADVCDPETTYIYKLYKNGQLIYSQDKRKISEEFRRFWGWPHCGGVAETITHLPLTLAVRWRSGPSQTFGSSCRFADIRVWSKERSLEEISGDYTARLTGSETKLHIYYPVTPEDKEAERTAKRLRNHAQTGSHLDGHLGCLSLAHQCSPSQGYGTELLPTVMWRLAPLLSTTRVSPYSTTVLLLQPKYFVTERKRGSDTYLRITSYPSPSCGKIGLRPAKDTAPSSIVTLREAGVNDELFERVDLAINSIVFKAETSGVKECDTVLGWRLLNLRGDLSLQEAKMQLKVEISPPSIIFIEEFQGVRFQGDDEVPAVNYNVLLIRFSIPTTKPPISHAAEWSRFVELDGAEWGVSIDSNATATVDIQGEWSADGRTLSLLLYQRPALLPQQAPTASPSISTVSLAGVQTVRIRGGDAALSDFAVLSQLHRNLSALGFVSQPSWITPPELVWESPDWLPAPPLGWKSPYADPKDDPFSSSVLEQSLLRGVSADDRKTRWVDAVIPLTNGIPQNSTPCPPNQVYFTSTGNCAPCGALKTIGSGGGYCECIPGYRADDLQHVITNERFLHSDALSCSPCPPGTENRRGHCITCAEGFYNGEEAQVSCRQCPPGTYRNISNAPTSCLPCPEGSDSEEGSRSCRPCRPGSYARPRSTESSNELCQLCPTGTYTVESGSVSCRPCPGHRTTAFPGASLESDCLCDGGYYLDRVTNECQPCQLGMICEFGKPWPSVAEGYWVSSLSESELEVYQSLDVYRCRGKTQCPSRTIDAPQCAGGRGARGFLCLDCPAGWYQSGPGQCKECSNKYIFGSVVAIAALIFLILLIALYMAESRLSGTSHWGIVGLMVKFYSTLSVLSSFRTAYLEPVAGILDSGKIAALDTSVFRAGCFDFLQDPFLSYAIRITAPFLLVGVYGLLWGGSYLLRRKHSVPGRSKTRLQRFYKKIFQESAGNYETSRRVRQGTKTLTRSFGATQTRSPMEGEALPGPDAEEESKGDDKHAEAIEDTAQRGRTPISGEISGVFQSEDKTDSQVLAVKGQRRKTTRHLSLPISRRREELPGRSMSLYPESETVSIGRSNPWVALRNTCPWERNLVINCYLSLLHILFIALCQSSFLVFECYKHPNGKLSVVTFPTVLCYESQWWTRFVPLASIGIIAFVIGYTSLLSVVVLVAPRLASRHRWFGECFYFAFNPFRPSAWFFTVPLLFRNTMITMIPLFARENGQLQAFLLCVVLIAALIGQFVFWPWATSINNIVDVSLLTGLLFISMSAMYFAEKSADVASVFSGFAISGFVGANAVFIMGCVFVLLYRILPSKQQEMLQSLILAKQLKAEAAALASRSSEGLAQTIRHLTETDRKRIQGMYKILQRRKIAASRCQADMSPHNTKKIDGNDKSLGDDVEREKVYDASFEEREYDGVAERSRMSLLHAQALHDRLFGHSDSEDDAQSFSPTNEGDRSPDLRQHAHGEEMCMRESCQRERDESPGSLRSGFDSVLAREVIAAARSSEGPTM